MRSLAIIITGVLSISIVCVAESEKLPQKHSPVLQSEDRFWNVSSKKQLPESIIKLCADHESRLADPGKKWQVGCIVDGTPSSRLIWAVTNGEYFVVHYERGGIARMFFVLIARITPESKLDVIWKDAGVKNPLKDYHSFLNMFVEPPAQHNEASEPK